MKGPWRDRKRGSTMVEFALTFTLLLTLSIGAMEGARALWTYITLAHAARAAARYAMVRGGDTPISDSDIETYLLSRSPGLDVTALTTSVVWTPDSSVGSSVEVRVSYSFDFVASALFLSRSRLTLFSSSRMPVAN